MSRPTGNEFDDRDRDELAACVRSIPKADPKLSTIDKLRRIVEDKQANRVNGVFVDLYSASAVVKVYDALNDKNKEKLAKLSVRKMVQVCFGFVK